MKLSSISALISAVKSSADFEVLQRDGWVVVVDGRVYLGPRGVAELDVATRNSLPTCSFCHEIVVGVRTFCLRRMVDDLFAPALSNQASLIPLAFASLRDFAVLSPRGSGFLCSVRICRCACHVRAPV